MPVLEEDPPSIRIPDLAVVMFSEENAELVGASEVRLAVEVVSPGSGRIDRVRKLREYAEAGVPEYWILDRSDRALSTFVLEGDGYVLTGTHAGPATLAPCGVSLVLDVSTLA